MVIEVVATSSAIRSPVTHSTRSHHATRCRRRPATGRRPWGRPASWSPGVQQPILQVAPVHQVDRAELFAVHPGPHLARHRVEPVGEGHGVDHARAIRPRPRAVRPPRLMPSGFSHSTCLPASISRDRVRHMRGVGGADMHDVHVAVGHLIDVVVRHARRPRPQRLGVIVPGWRPSRPRSRRRPASRPGDVPPRSSRRPESPLASPTEESWSPP